MTDKTVNQLHQLALPRSQKGVTITELLIGIAIVAIVTTLVIPSGRDILVQNRIVAEINETSALVQFARSYAIDNQIDTVICPAGDFVNCETDWAQPKIVFADLNNDNIRNADEELLVANSLLSPHNLLTGPATPIRFQASGSVSSPATLLMCHKDREDKFARALTVSLQGRVKNSQDTNNDGIHETNAGTPLDCG